MSELAVAPGIILPKSPMPPLLDDPKTLILYSSPKIGKTTLLSSLPNCLILDLENGTDYLSALKLKAEDASGIKLIIDTVIAAGNPYDYIAVDTISALEEILLPYAEQLYANSPEGKTWYEVGRAKYGSLLNMPNGSGYAWIRLAYQNVLNYIKRASRNLILVGHVKDTVADANGTDVTVRDIDLTGKLKRITTNNADAIGFIYRKKDANWITFKSSDEVSCGARPAHLKNQTFIISEITPDGYKSYWEKIYTNINK